MRGVARIFQGGGTTVSKQRVLTNVRHLSNVRFLLEKRITYGGSRAPKDQPLSYTLFFKFFLVVLRLMVNSIETLV